ncbi:MAG: 4-alpha-glucanotransferase [Niabella sp.]
MRFVFYLRYYTRVGESLWISGNAAELGGDHQMVEMKYFNHDYWKLEINIDIEQLQKKTLQYRYLFKGTNGELVDEFQQPRTIFLATSAVATLKVYDTWNFAGAFGNVFYTAPFQKILLAKHKEAKYKAVQNPATHIFKIKAPLLGKNEVLCLTGEGDILNNWSADSPVLLKYDDGEWFTELEFSGKKFPIAYKYGIYNKKDKRFVQYEEGGNRVCFEPAVAGELTLLQDGFLNVPDNTWRGAGVAIPVFSLRSKSGLGIGEFKDLKLLVDWAAATDLKLIQILPINDTTATHTWRDSYPYAAISAFALHPIYINLEAVAGKKHKHLIEGLKRKGRQLNELATVDYESVLKFKLAVLETLFRADGADCCKTDDYKEFFEKNKHWLKAYAAFCYLRDKYKTSDPARWGKYSSYAEREIDNFFDRSCEAYLTIQFHCYIQFQLHLQLKDAVAYAHRKGIIIKGDIPIGVYRYGCDAWVAPALYKMELQAGAPPDDFAVKGQNWGFPTYNWQQMQYDGFGWWKSRFRQMSHYFDAFRIDHILGFFRIWSIPMDAVQGVMGRFDPCLPLHVNEFGENGIWFDYERLCMPYITEEVLKSIFGDKAAYVKDHFLQKHGPQQYALLPRFDTQRKVEAFFETETDPDILIKEGLYDLISNVLLFEQAGSGKTEFHFRISIDQTTSFRYLQPSIREKLWELYIDYFYRRQNDFWRKESLKKLPRLKSVTNMLVCGEDLGMVPGSVPGVMKQLGILSLEIQRMPKQQGVEFFNPKDAPYLSVVTPSTHDMSTIRGWWEEDRNITQHFYNHELGLGGEAPYFCEPWINRAIVLQHLYSPAMWSIFQLQDILGISAGLRRQDPGEERINVPANPQHYWRYRMHITLEALIKQKEFNKELKEYIHHSGRAD